LSTFEAFFRKIKKKALNEAWCILEVIPTKRKKYKD
jgi:hypothetical protein